MSGIATLHLIGNLTRDAESRYTPSGAQNLTFTVAVNGRKDQSGNEPVAFYRVTAWGKLAEVLERLSLTKGQSVYVAGSLQPREYQANDGTNRTSLDVNAGSVQLLGSRDQQPMQDGDAPF